MQGKHLLQLSELDLLHKLWVPNLSSRDGEEAGHKLFKAEQALQVSTARPGRRACLSKLLWHEALRSWL